MTSPTQPPGGPQKKPIESPIGKTPPPPKNSSSSKNEGFGPMLDKMGLSPSQKKMFFNNLMKQAANTIKTAFRHLVEQMKKNRND